MAILTLLVRVCHRTNRILVLRLSPTGAQGLYTLGQLAENLNRFQYVRERSKWDGGTVSVLSSPFVWVFLK